MSRKEILKEIARLIEEPYENKELNLVPSLKAALVAESVLIFLESIGFDSYSSVLEATDWKQYATNYFRRNQILKFGVEATCDCGLYVHPDNPNRKLDAIHEDNCPFYTYTEIFSTIYPLNNPNASWRLPK